MRDQHWLSETRLRCHDASQRRGAWRRFGHCDRGDQQQRARVTNSQTNSARTPPVAIGPRTLAGGLRRAAEVPVMQAAEHLAGSDWPHGGRLERARLGRILREAEVGPAAVVVLGVLAEQEPGVGLAKDDDVVEQFAPQGADDALTVRVLPGRTRGRDDLLDAHGRESRGDGVAVDAIPGAMEEARRGVEGEGLAELLARPRGSRVRGDRDVADAAAAVLEDDEAVEQLKGRGRNDEEVHRRGRGEVIPEEGAPGLRGRPLRARARRPSSASPDRRLRSTDYEARRN